MLQISSRQRTMAMDTPQTAHGRVYEEGGCYNIRAFIINQLSGQLSKIWACGVCFRKYRHRTAVLEQITKDNVHNDLLHNFFVNLHLSSAALSTVRCLRGSLPHPAACTIQENPAKAWTVPLPAGCTIQGNPAKTWTVPPPAACIIGRSNWRRAAVPYAGNRHLGE